MLAAIVARDPALMPDTAHPRVEPHRHRIEDLVADRYALEARRQRVEPLHAGGQMRGARGQRGLLAGAQFAGQLDDPVARGQLAFVFERQQQIRRQPAGAGAEFHHLVQAELEPLGQLARQRAGEERGQLGGGDEVAAVAHVAAELGRTAAVVPEPGRVERHRHIAVEAQPALRGVDRLADARGQCRGGVERVRGGKG